MEPIINAVGLRCPQPIIETKKALDTLEEGTVTTIVDNADAVENLSIFSGNFGYTVSHVKKENLYHVYIRKERPNGSFGIVAADTVNSAELGNAANSPAAANDSANPSENRMVSTDNLVILIASDAMGGGEQELGESLMKSYLYALTEVKPRPKTLLFMNRGVFFTSENSPVEESLRKLEAEGVEILSCGACLNYYGLSDKLILGTISNMYTIAEKMNNASNTIKL